MVLDIDAADNWATFKAIGSSDAELYFNITDKCKIKCSVIEINNIRASALGQNTITFSYDVEVISWGSDDVQIDLNINDLFTIS